MKTMRLKPLSTLTLLAALYVAYPLSGADPADGPTVTRVMRVDASELCVEVLEGRIERLGQAPFTPAAGDRLEPTGDEVLAWDDGEPAWVPKEVKVYREVDGREVELGYYLEHAGVITYRDRLLGEALDTGEALLPASYLLCSGDDGAYAGGEEPLAVSRKSKPVDEIRTGGGQSIRHRIYLAFAEPLEEGARYTLELPGLNTQEAEVSFSVDADRQWTEALHVNQVGYHPEDGWKRALLSLWKGTAGGHDYDAWVGREFEIVNAFTGAVVHTGTIEKALDAASPDGLVNGVNNAQASVYHMNFDGFSEVGRFYLRVPGLGRSHAFPVAKHIWREAFRVAMLGYLHQRSGIELGPPFTTFERPLTFHPDMGQVVLRTDVMTVQGESAAIRESLGRLMDTAEPVADAWGGYMDAGDWDRRSQHLDATYKHLELFELYPDYYAGLALSLPPDEAENGIPDLLDEALWNIAFYRRLQTAEGGVRGGIESTAHPRGGEASWQESLLVGAFLPDALSSLRFAAAAAKAARLLEPYDAALAAGLATDAARAWTWAEANARATIEAVDAGEQDDVAADLENQRLIAAVELYWLTGEASYRGVFEDAANAASAIGSLPRDALFTYARLPAAMADAALQAGARQAIVDLGEAALAFQAGNPYGIASDNPSFPMMGYLGYFSTPQMTPGFSLPRAHFLSGDARFLAGAVGATNFPNGANPDNLVYTTGMGQSWPTRPLHIDSGLTGQPAPAGITIYGPSDPANEDFTFNNWVHTWRLADSMTPGSRTWPAAESHVNLFGWPSMSEYTVHQTLNSTGYFWGYLAGHAAHPDGADPGVGQDADGDGLEDAFEFGIIHFNTTDGIRRLADVRPQDDFDRDGKTNREEMLTGSLPTVPGVGRLSFSQAVEDFPQVRFLQAERGPFHFMTSGDLRAWSPHGESFDAVGEIHTTDLSAVDAAPVFIRVERPAQM